MLGRVLRTAMLFGCALVTGTSLVSARDATVPGQWATTDTSQSPSIDWGPHWRGEKNLRAQWWKILAESPKSWVFEHHAKGEPPGNTYYIWRHDKPLPAGTKLLIEGDFPHARLFDIQVCAPWQKDLPYIGDGTGVQEVPLLDEDIVPDPGHTNPYRAGADRTAKKRHFHVTLELRDGDPVALNPQAMVPPYRAPGNLRVGCTRVGKNGERGPVVWMRVYLPDRYQPYGGVEPPVMRLQLPGQKPVLAPITREVELNIEKTRADAYRVEENPADRDGRSIKEREAHEWLRQWALKSLRNAGTPGQIEEPVRRFFTRRDGSITLLKLHDPAFYLGWLKHIRTPDACTTRVPRAYRWLYGKDHNGAPPANDEHTSGQLVYNTYLVSGVTLGPDELLVYQGKAPKTPRTLGGDKIMGSSAELRYWNITLQAGSPTRLTTVVSISDEEIITDRDGRYTLVVGPARARPNNATAENGITWFDWPTGNALAMLVRYTSTASTPWEHAPQRITWEDTDYCDNNRWPVAVRERMGDYAINGRYMTRNDVERLGKTGRPPYSQPASWH